MKIVIDIDKEIYEWISRNGFVAEEDSQEIGEAIHQGIPLPKGHGRLIDADAFSGDMFCDADLTNQHTCYDSILKSLQDAPTIIEADKE